MCGINVHYTAQARDVEFVYEGIMLSCRASERQRRSPLQLALTFQRAMVDHITVTDDKSARELAFERVVDDYNCFGAVAVNKRWQIQGEERAAVRNLCLSVAEPVRDMMRRHYDRFKGSDSGARAQSPCLLPVICLSHITTPCPVLACVST